jgi:hypothetical protein
MRREDDGDQMIPLRVHVAEGRGNEDADGLQYVRHLQQFVTLEALSKLGFIGDFHRKI